MTRTDTTTDRTIESTDPRAVLRAWAGADRSSATMDMGGWPTSDRAAFEAAVRAEFEQATGEEPGAIIIERT